MPEKPKRIHLLGDGRHEEAVAAAGITPGHLIALNSDGKVVVHPTSGGYAETAFALEDALQGRTIDKAYVADEVVSYVLAEGGDVVYAWLNVGENVAIGDLLSSNGDGTLEKVSGAEIPLAIALETLNLSDSEHAPERIRVRTL